MNITWRNVAVMVLVLGLGPIGSRVHAAPGPEQWVVQLGAAVTTAPSPSVELKWPNDTKATSWTVYRRSPDINGYTNWGVAMAGPATNSPFVIKGTELTLTDTNVAVGSAYEYRVVKAATDGYSYTADGFLLVGIEEPPLESRGKLILMVDDRFTTSLAPELTRLMNDMAGDGWELIRHDVDASMGVTNLKALIMADYVADPGNVKSVFLFGHFAVPYSGALTADGHNSEHLGAWPADVYYGDKDESLWTDSTVDTDNDGTPTTPTVVKHRNIPGDGKYDQNSVPIDASGLGIVELEVARVDLAQMPAFGVSETELLRRYLHKDHAYRHRAFNPGRRALNIDGFGDRTDGFRNFAAFFGYSNISKKNSLFWFPTLVTNSYLCALGSGGGQPTSNLGIGTTTDFANNTMNAVFTLLYGSFNGVWDYENSILRAPLASQPSGLTCMLSTLGWSLHEMGLGRHIGFSARRSSSRGAGMLPYGGYIYAALMGDPTLRMFMPAPPTFVAVSSNGSGGVTVSWGASPDAVAGYQVYRGTSATGAFTRLNGSLVSGTNYTDATPPGGTNVYRVRAVKRESVNSGFYYNPSQGIPARYPAQLNQVVVTTAGGAPQSLPATNLLASGSYCSLTVPPETKPAGFYVCTWTGTGSVPSSGQGTNVAVFLDQDSTIQWQWTANQDSTVTVTSPKQDSVYTAPATVVLSATASDPDGLIARVEFYQGTTLVGQDADSVYDFVADPSASYYVNYGQTNIATYTYSWQNVSTGAYVIRAVAYDSFGAATTSAPLNFTVGTTAIAPTITTQPVDTTVTVGQSATYTVGVSGSSPFWYQWRYQNAAAGGGNPVNIAFATFDWYATPYPAQGYNGQSGTRYSVVVSNQTGSVTSEFALLTLSAAILAPAITAQPTNRTVTVGQTATFSVTASGTSPLYYQWRTNGTAIGGATSASHTTPATVTNHSGTLYSVVVSNTMGSVTSVNALLTVTLATPAITMPPTNRTVTAGQTASFSVTATGTAPLYYQWRTNGVAINGAIASSHTTPATTTNESGTLYSVVVSNTVGSVTSVNATLTVNAAAVAAGLPVSDSFEPYAPGAGVTGTNGWVGAVDAGLVTAMTYAVKLPPGYPLPKAVHSRVVQISTSLQNALPGASNQNVAVDFMLQTGNRAAPEPPAMSLQAGLCVDTQGVVQVWHLYDNGGTWTQRWTALANAPLGTSQWVRVSVWLDYTNNPAGHTLFRPALDGVVYPTGYGVASPTDLTGPGAWYVCANSPATGRGGARKITGFRIESDQPCRLDDFLVTPGSLAYTVPGGLLMIR